MGMKRWCILPEDTWVCLMQVHRRSPSHSILHPPARRVDVASLHLLFSLPPFLLPFSPPYPPHKKRHIGRVAEPRWEGKAARRGITCTRTGDPPRG